MRHRYRIGILLLFIVLLMSADCYASRGSPQWGQEVTDGKLNCRNGTPYGIMPRGLVCTTYCGSMVHKYYGIPAYPSGGFVRSHQAWMDRHARTVCSMRGPEDYAREHRKIRPGDIVCFNTGRNYSGVWMHIAIVGGDRRTLHHAVRTGVSYRYSLYGWISYLHQARSCKVYRLLKGRRSMRIHEKRAPVRYLKRSGHRVDLLEMLPKSITRRYGNPQGACCDGRYTYLVLLHRRFPGRFARILKFDMQTKRILKISGRLPIGHANDMILAPNGKELLLTYLASPRKRARFLSRVDTASLRFLGRKRLRLPKKYKSIRGFSGICWDPVYKHYGLKVRMQNAVLWTRSDFRPLRLIRYRNKYHGLRNQVISMEGNQLLRLDGKGQKYNLLHRYRRNGHRIRSRLLRVKGQVQGMFQRGTETWFLIHRQSHNIQHIYLGRLG